MISAAQIAPEPANAADIVAACLVQHNRDHVVSIAGLIEKVRRLSPLLDESDEELADLIAREAIERRLAINFNARNG